MNLDTGKIVAVGTTACLGVMIEATLRLAGTKPSHRLKGCHEMFKPRAFHICETGGPISLSRQRGSDVNGQRLLRFKEPWHQVRSYPQAKGGWYEGIDHR